MLQMWNNNMGKMFCRVGSTALMSRCQNGSMSIHVLALCTYQGSLGNWQ